MKKLLIVILIILMIVLISVSIFSGISISTFRIFDMKDIQNLGQNLDDRLAENNRLVEIDFNEKIATLQSSIKDLNKAKQEYEALANSYTSEEIRKASISGEYKSEFIWVTLGNYATKEGLDGKFDLIESSSGTSNLEDIKFTLVGSYSGITEFIYSIENDEELRFKIEEFELMPGDKGAEALQATFTVKDLSIIN